MTREEIIEQLTHHFAEINRLLDEIDNRLAENYPEQFEVYRQLIEKSHSRCASEVLK